MRIRWSYALALSLLPAAVGAAPAQKGLDFYFVDVEGGAATLIVTPAGESVLIDIQHRKAIWLIRGNR